MLVREARLEGAAERLVEQVADPRGTVVAVVIVAIVTIFGFGVLVQKPDDLLGLGGREGQWLGKHTTIGRAVARHRARQGADTEPVAQIALQKIRHQQR